LLAGLATRSGLSCAAIANACTLLSSVGSSETFL
jgi:hypothetical protein